MAKGGFRGGNMGGGMNMNMIKQAQKMQADMMKMQADMEEKEYSATVGGGRCHGCREWQSMRSFHSKFLLRAVDPEDVDMLQDMVVAAVNEALRNAELSMSENMSKITGGLNLGF